MLRYIFILLLLAISAQADSLLVAAGVSVDDISAIKQNEPQLNFGGSWNMRIGTGYNPGDYEYRALFRFNILDDSIANHPGVTWDSARLVVKFEALTMEAGDSLALDLYPITTAGWQEGLGENDGGVDSGGVTWDSASATGLGGLPNPLDWTLDGGDFSATREGLGLTDTVWMSAGTDSTLSFHITGATIADSMNNGAGVMMKYYHLYDATVDGAIMGSLYSDRQPSNRPFLVVYYSAGSEPEPTTKTVKKVHLRKVKL